MSLLGFPACSAVIDIAIVCDGSNSIYPWAAVRNFLEKFVEGLDVGPTKTQVIFAHLHFSV